MAKFTRQAIMYSTLKLLQVKPIDKITVRDICDQCELTRNTFYYYFSDIYEVVEELLKFETDKSLSEQQEFDSLYDAYLQKYHLVLEYKNAVYHLYHSKNRDMILRYLYDITEDFVGKYVRNEVRGHHLNEEDIHFIKTKAEILAHMKLIDNYIAIAECPEGTEDSQVLAGQIADYLVTVKEIRTSFLFYHTDNGLCLSARSDGSINVQVVMEALGGGGHLTVAGCQLGKDGNKEVAEKVILTQVRKQVEEEKE